MHDNKKAIITSASNKFFPNLLNFIGSIKANYPNHPPIYVYDLGLFASFKKEIASIPRVQILETPRFCNHWRSCYTWKTYILNTPLADLNLYLDAGCQVLKSLDILFEKINAQGYLAVSQGTEVKIKDITPADFIEHFGLNETQLAGEVIAAGIFGFKKDSHITNITQKLYVCGVLGLSLGFSKRELWKNKGVNKTTLIRDCNMFRHDTTLLTIILHKELQDLVIEPIFKFSGQFENSPEQFIYSVRLNYKKLEYTDIKLIHGNQRFGYTTLNRLFLNIFLILKSINRIMKSSLRKLTK